MNRTIPEISDARVAELVERLPPVIQGDGGYLLISIPDTRSEAFTWDPVVVDSTVRHLVPCGTAQTYYTWGYYGFFKPSLAEVYACVDGSIPDDAEFFWLDTSSVQVEGQPLLHKPDVHCPDGYHRATVTFLKRGAA